MVLAGIEIGPNDGASRFRHVKPTRSHIGHYPKINVERAVLGPFDVFPSFERLASGRPVGLTGPSTLIFKRATHHCALPD